MEEKFFEDPHREEQLEAVNDADLKRYLSYTTEDLAEDGFEGEWDF